jgi:hypothetical protein
MTIDPAQQYQLCPICGMAVGGLYTGRHQLECIRCGRFSVGDIAAMDLENPPLSARQQANISGYIFENQGLQIVDRNVKFLRELRAPTLAYRATKLLIYLANQQPTLGETIDISEWASIDKLLSALRTQAAVTMHGSTAQKLQPLVPLLSATWSMNAREVAFLLTAYLHAEEHLVEVQESGARKTVVITPKGWKHIETRPTGEGATGFVAMWFAPEMDPVWEEAFYPAIYDAGYTPLRIDKKEHNNKIDDEILASIRTSKFIIADFTEQRGGVYYEAGFASGLGKPVIYTVRNDHLHSVHFDTRQFNHISWDPADVGTLRRALQKRIEATFGRGPILPS